MKQCLQILFLIICLIDHSNISLRNDHGSKRWYSNQSILNMVRNGINCINGLHSDIPYDYKYGTKRQWYSTPNVLHVLNMVRNGRRINCAVTPRPIIDLYMVRNDNCKVMIIRYFSCTKSSCYQHVRFPNLYGTKRFWSW